MIWVGKVASPGAYQTVWSMGLNSLVYAEGGPNHNFRIYVNGYSNYISYSAYLDKTIMLTVRSSNGGTTVQGRIGTGSWQTLSSIGPWNNPVQGMRFGIDYNGAYTSTTLTESLMWVYSDDLTDAEVAANFNWAGAEIAARGGSLEGYTGGPAYTTDHLEAFWKFDEGSGTTLNDSAGTYNGTISGTPDWTTDPTGLYASSADTGATSFGASGNQLSATSGQDYTVIWVGKVASPGAYQTLWSMGLNSLVYAEGGPNHNFRIYVNGYSNYISYSAYLDKTIMLTVRSSNGGTTVQGRIGTGSWQTLSSIGPWNNPVQGMRFGIDYNGAYTSTTLTESLMWVHSDDLTDAEVAANFNWAGAEIAARGGSLEGYTGGPAYTTDHLEAFWKFDEGSGTTLNDSAGTYNGTISGTPDWTTDPTGLYASNADTGATSFGASGNQLSATSGQDYTVIWVGKVASPGAYQTLWSMGLNSLVYAEGGPNHNFRIYVNGYSNYISYSAYLDKTIMLTVRSSNGGTTVQGRIGTGSWQTLSSIGPWNNPVQGMRFGIDYNGAYTSTTLTESLVWVYSDDLTDAEIQANYDWADAEITARGGTLQ